MVPRSLIIPYPAYSDPLSSYQSHQKLQSLLDVQAQKDYNDWLKTHIHPSAGETGEESIHLERSTA